MSGCSCPGYFIARVYGVHGYGVSLAASVLDAALRLSVYQIHQNDPARWPARASA